MMKHSLVYEQHSGFLHRQKNKYMSTCFHLMNQEVHLPNTQKREFFYFSIKNELLLIPSMYEIFTNTMNKILLELKLFNYIVNKEKFSKNIFY